MDIKKFLKKEVKHKAYGVGQIVSLDEKYIQINFPKTELKEFQFPDVFAEYLVMCDDALQKELLSMVEEKSKIKAESKKETIQDVNTYRKEILKIGDSFSTHAEALNDCFGFQYKHFQKAYKVVDDNYAVWFPNIAKQVLGEYVSTDKTLGWVNVLTEKGTVLIENDNHEEHFLSSVDIRKRLVFAKQEGDTRYMFIGLFDEGERIEGGVKHNLVSREFDLIKMKPKDAK